MTRAVTARLRQRRLLLLIIFDTAAWIAALALVAAVRLDVAEAPVPWIEVLQVGLLAAGLHVAGGWVVRLHHGRAATGSFDEMLLLGSVVASVTVIVTAVNALLPQPWLPRSVPFAAGFIALAFTGWGRAVWRRLQEREFEGRPEGVGRPTLVLGAGDGGRQLINSMLRDSERTWRPVGLLDDDPRKRHRRIRGVPVRGSLEDLETVVEATEAQAVVVAIPSANAALIRSIGRRARRLHVELKVVPGVNELFDGQVGISDIRDVDVTDLLGRHQVDTDVNAIASYLTGKRVLVTGAGGSIGSELCRQIHRFAPKRLIMLDRDESALHAVQLSIHGRTMLDSPDLVLADIRDSQLLLRIFEESQPEVIFHAAALKHLPILEQYPGEGVKTNVWGTLSVLEAAKATGVERFVNISTDKAANPISVLGYTKRLAEGLTAATAAEVEGTYLSVRFGNVLGSRGSVLTTFAAQIAAGGPLTVTDPLVTRYFMTVQEAVQLVIQAAAIGSDGEVLVLDMGEPVRIADVAKQLIDISGVDAEVTYTGLIDGEKLEEELFGAGESDERPVHPLVSHVTAPAFDPLAARALDPWTDPWTLGRQLRTACTDQMTATGAASTQREPAQVISGNGADRLRPEAGEDLP